MGNGRPHDHPISDILNHKILTFSETVDELICRIADIVTPAKIDEYVNWQNPPPLAEFEVELTETLKALEQDAT